MDLSAINASLRTDAIAHRLPVAADVPKAGENVILECIETERLGLRGPGTIEWLVSAGMTAPAAMNTAATLPCGTLVMRLGQNEVLLTAPPGGSGERLREIRRAWHASALAQKGYDAYRDEGWAWFIVSGPDAPTLMRRISMADLRSETLKVGDIAQTRAVHLDAVVARLDRFGEVSYDIFLDIASAAFVLDVLTETAAGIGAGFQLSVMRPAANGSASSIKPNLPRTER